MGNENTQPIKTAEEILDQMLSKQVLVKKIGQEPFNEALEAINQLLIEAKIEGRKIQAEATLDKWESGANECDMTLFLNAQVKAHRYELQQSLKENK